MSANITRYDAARQALAECQRIDEAKDIADRMAALKAYAVQAQDSDLEMMAAEIRLRAQRRIGELSAALDKAPRGGAGGTSKFPGGGKNAALKEANLSTSTAHRCETIATIPLDDIETYIAGKRDKGQSASSAEVIKMVGKSVRREQKVERLNAKNVPLEAGAHRYQVVYADPPWRYHNVLSSSRLIENQYPTMSLESIMEMPVADVAAEDAVLYLWATAPCLVDALDVVGAWGFDYRSCMVWIKPSIGAGYWCRQRHELLLIGARGEIPVPMEANRPDSVIDEPRGKHSAKPGVVYDIIERGFPEFSKIELFARQSRNGWASWGNEQ